MGQTFASFLLESFQFLWPFRRVHQWERGGLYVYGRFKQVLEPGMYFVIPWFMDVREISVVPAIISTPRLDITLKNGVTISLVASALVEVVDYNLACNTIDNYAETTQEMMSAVLADKLASVDPSRTDPANRGRLLADLTRWVDEEAQEYGLKVRKIRFTTFVNNLRFHRLLQDISPKAW